MSTILTARYQRDKSQSISIERRVLNNEISPSPSILSAFGVTLGKYPNPIVSQNFVESSNNRPRTLDSTNINQYYQSSAQVR